MTAILERMIAVIAPHACRVCGIEDNVLCTACQQDVFVSPPPACIFCATPTADWQLCGTCRRLTGLEAVFVASMYEGVPAAMLQDYKFKRLKAAHKPLAVALDDALPYLAADTLVVPLPTAPRRIRQRGYDHTLLLAKRVAAARKLLLALPLERATNTRQVGASRTQRQTQATHTYRLAHPSAVKDKKVLLIDDICTTGASLAAAAALMRAAGAKEVRGAVVAWQNKNAKRLA